VLLAFLCLASVSQARPFPEFPSRFHAFFQRNSNTYGVDMNTNRYLVLNADAKKVYISVAPTVAGDLMIDDAGEHWLIQNATTGTFTYYTRNEKLCTYQTVQKGLPRAFDRVVPEQLFPQSWSGDGFFPVTVASWFFAPTTMTYAGSYWWNGTQVDSWIGGGSCFFYEYIPCYRYITKKGTNIPIVNYLSHNAPRNSFEPNWISTNNWIRFSTENIPTAQLEPPANARINCWNGRNGFEISVNNRAFVSTPTGSDNFTIALHAEGAPISEYGPVAVTFEVSPATMKFVTKTGGNLNTIYFTAANHTTPVSVFLKYVSEGDTYFTIRASGGGYSLAGNSVQVSYRIVTCAAGKVGYGC